MRWSRKMRKRIEFVIVELKKLSMSIGIARVVGKR